jgi:hypothetical protein
MNHYYYSGDPYWTSARYRSTCRKCGKAIGKGSQIFYYPNGKYVLCHECGQPASAEFNCAAQDKDFLNSQRRDAY